MCIAIWKPARVKLFEDVFRDCFAWHSDGAGFLVHDPATNQIIMRKGFFTIESFMKAFRPFMEHAAVIHFRMATHGVLNAENCHPFMVNDDLGFVHNGVIGNVKEWDKTKSDTWHFNEAMLKPLYRSFGKSVVSHRTIRHLIERYINKNKLVFMDNEGKVTIYNEDLGIWDTGCWFSNDTYMYTPQQVAEYFGYDPEKLGSDEDNAGAVVKLQDIGCGCDGNIGDMFENAGEDGEIEDELDSEEPTSKNVTAVGG